MRSSSTQSRSPAGSDRRSLQALTAHPFGRRPWAGAGLQPAPAKIVTNGDSSPTMACRDCGKHGLLASRIRSSLPTDRRPRNLRSCVKHLSSRRPRWHPGRPLGTRPTPLWNFGRSHAAAVKGRFAGLRPPLTAADYVLETPAPVLRITHVAPAPYRTLGIPPTEMIRRPKPVAGVYPDRKSSSELAEGPTTLVVVPGSV